ncbi:CmpA/NrtA family ABC transporter substrate-binding protein [Cerasicoccus maritimus]|uniref:CmpA/NrtA family ABC transporter substrate-binding protein n=1 Tax=Cerasicoccus maritimus TaxID=490089 RepID=UPI0028528157|nr:CmpA/NrtA family ABC transporter substrate-binding protein [Cerasicoccus maritimus]
MALTANNANTIKIGLVRLLDAAPYILAGELGYYQEAGLNVKLTWELGWATVKHKIAYGELDAAHGLAPLPMAISIGYEVAARPCEALMVTSRLGNAITLSNNIRARGVQTADDFRAEVRSMRGQRLYKLGVVSLDSCHYFLMRQWLTSIRLDPSKDVKIVVIPPGQAVRNLRAGTLDGYCVGEPWNSLAVREGLGWTVAVSHDLAPNHPEKVLLALTSKIKERPKQYEALVGALQKACAYCADPENIVRVSRQMRRVQILGSTAQGAEKILRGEYDRGGGLGSLPEPVIDFCANGQTQITAADVAWITLSAKQAEWSGVPTHTIMDAASSAYPSN